MFFLIFLLKHERHGLIKKPSKYAFNETVFFVKEWEIGSHIDILMVELKHKPQVVIKGRRH